LSEPDSNVPDSKPAPDEEIVNIILKRINALERAHEGKDELDYKQRQLRFNKWLTILTACLVATSLVLNYLTYRQAVVSETAANAAKKSVETMQAVEAASMAKHKVSCSTEPQPLSLKTEVTINFKNAGRSRAENLQVHVFLAPEGVVSTKSEGGVSTHVFLVPLGPEGNVFTKSQGGVSIGSVAAGESRESTLIVSRGFTDKMLAQINNGILKMHLTGWLTYNDIFSKGHKMDFDSIYEPNTACLFDIIKETNL
jgi:hypothetical protein